MKATRKHRILSRAVAEATKVRTSPPATLSDSPFVPKPRTKVDELYALIEDASNLWFTDEDGKPWIEKDGIEDKGNGLYIVRFRCPKIALYTRIPLNKVVECVCTALNSEVRYFCKEKEFQYGNGTVLRYYDCVWVICEGELAKGDGERDEDLDISRLEEIEGEISDESTAEELDERMEECLANFL